MRWVFWASAILIVYTYAGYLAWLWFRAQLRPWPVLKGSYQPILSIAMVVRNEEGLLEAKLHNLLSLDYPAKKREIVVVSDGSTDGTNQILVRFEREGVTGVVLDQSQGKAVGLNRAVQEAHGEIVVFTDVRQMIEHDALARLLENFIDESVGCVSGELMLGDTSQGESSQGMGLYWRIEKRIRDLESATGSVVGATGALYAVRRALLAPLPPGLILDDVLTPMQVAREGKRVLFEPQARAWDTPDLGQEREFNRKVRTLSGNYQLVQLAPWLLSGENPIRFEFISHKLLRLVVPFALITLFVSSALATGAIYRFAFIAQLCFYALSLLAMARLKVGPVARLADAALTFVLLNGAAAVAFANFVSGRKAVWVR